MESRTEKYSTRSSKNKDLYNDLYKDTNYTNTVVIDDSNEIDINKIKQILDNEKRPTRVNNLDSFDSLKAYYGIKDEPEEEPVKNYDINEVLKEAKNKRNIIEEANEKRKIENFKFKNNLDLQEELSKTRKMYNDLVKEESELLNIMNTLTNVDISAKEGTKANLNNTASMALDLLNTISDETKTKMENAMPEKIVATPKVTKVEADDDSKEYSTDTFMFETKDFEGLKTVKDGIKRNSTIIRVLIFIFTIILLVGCYYIIIKHIL